MNGTAVVLLENGNCEIEGSSSLRARPTKLQSRVKVGCGNIFAFSNLRVLQGVLTMALSSNIKDWEHRFKYVYW